MCLIVVTFNTTFCSMIVDGRMPVFEGTRQGLYMIPEDSVNLFCQTAMQTENVIRAVIYRHYRTHKK